MSLQEAGQIGTQRVHAALQAVVEHIADHDHPALRPLAHAAEFRMAELRHPAAAGAERRKQRLGRACANAMALGHLGHQMAALFRQILHGSS